jgi:mRNA interferase MazF
MPYEFGDVVLVRFPFTNQATFKKRPASMVSSRAYNVAKPDVIIMAITSQVHSSSSLGEVQVAQWQAANLLKPSAIKPVFATSNRISFLKPSALLDPLIRQRSARRSLPYWAKVEDPGGDRRNVPHQKWGVSIA